MHENPAHCKNVMQKEWENFSLEFVPIGNCDAKVDGEIKEPKKVEDEP